MTKTEPTLDRLIMLAMDVERHAYAFYHAMAQRYGNEQEVADCLNDIKEDEKLHLRVLTEIRASLSDTRLASPVDKETIDRMETASAFMDSLDFASLNTTDKVLDAVQQLEAVEFDVVMSFVDTDEINFEFTREYLKNETVDHARRVSQILFSID